MPDDPKKPNSVSQERLAERCESVRVKVSHLWSFHVMAETFPDLRDQLFGRAQDVNNLLHRADHSGLTALVAQPLMGKTRTLLEVQRRLLEETQYLVGYSESPGPNNHLLHAVHNLYSRWLADSTMREQAISIWERNKDSLVPHFGQMVGALFEKLGKNLLPVGAAVQAVFDGLAAAQKDLLTGGVSLAPRPYDQALSMVSLVAKVSGRKVVLILDAWEKSPSIRFECDTLEMFLKHIQDWPHTHVFLAVRRSATDSWEHDGDAYQRVETLCDSDPHACKFPLKLMNLEDQQEQDRMISFVRSRIPAAKNQSAQSILDMIAGYPGVLYFWTAETNRTAMRTKDDLRRIADNAQNLRYVDLAQLLSVLHDEKCTLSARLAFFPQLNAESWEIFRDILLSDLTDVVVDDLINDKVLINESFPTYGHDTRHAAARRWFIDNKPALIRRISKQFIEAFASRVTGINRASLPFAATLVVFSETSRQVKTDLVLCCLLDAARAWFSDVGAVSRSEFDVLYPKAVQRNGLFAPLIGLSLLIRGVMKGVHGENDGAISDCTAVIELPGAPAELVAQAFYNRGVMKGVRGENGGAIADYTAAIDLPGASADTVARALVNRGVKKGECGENGGAIADYTAAIELPGASADPVARALVNRGVKKHERGDVEEAIVDFTAAIELPGASADPVAHALFNRGVKKGKHGDKDGAIADYTAAIELPGAPADQVARALINRGATKGERGDVEGAIADYTAAINLPGAFAEEVAQALVNRGITKDQHGDRGELPN